MAFLPLMAFESISFTFRFAVILVQWWRLEKRFPMHPVIGIAKQLVQHSANWLDAQIDLSMLENVHLTRVLDITPPNRITCTLDKGSI